MKKLFIIGALAIGVIASAFPFKSSCGIVFQINEDSVKHMTPSELDRTLKGLNFNACGVFPSKIVYFTSSAS